MKIGVISTLGYAVPPTTYGGTEIVVYHLVEGLVKRGHEVTLFAAEGSRTSGKLDAQWNNLQVGSSLAVENILYTLERINYLIERSSEFDIIHNNEGFAVMAHEQYFKCPMVTTFHASPARSVKNDPMRQVIMMRNKMISISYNQREGFPDANYIGNVYHGTTDFSKYKLGEGGDYLAWLGRFNPYKGAHEAIEVAKKTGRKLIMAGRIEPENLEYYNNEIKPHVDGKQIEYIGEIDIPGKNQLLGNALALLMPISWEEPFGLVVIEAMACGTPVIAFNRGSMSELIVDGKTGYICDSGDISQMVQAVEKAGGLDRAACRQHVQENFSEEKMTLGYEDIFKKVINKEI